MRVEGGVFAKLAGPGEMLEALLGATRSGHEVFNRISRSDTVSSLIRRLGLDAGKIDIHQGPHIQDAMTSVLPSRHVDLMRSLLSRFAPGMSIEDVADLQGIGHLIPHGPGRSSLNLGYGAGPLEAAHELGHLSLSGMPVLGPLTDYARLAMRPLGFEGYGHKLPFLAGLLDRTRFGGAARAVSGAGTAAAAGMEAGASAIGLASLLAELRSRGASKSDLLRAALSGTKSMHTAAGTQIVFPTMARELGAAISRRVWPEQRTYAEAAREAVLNAIGGRAPSGSRDYVAGAVFGPLAAAYKAPSGEKARRFASALADSIKYRSLAGGAAHHARAFMYPQSAALDFHPANAVGSLGAAVSGAMHARDATLAAHRVAQAARVRNVAKAVAGAGALSAGALAGRRYLSNDGRE